MKRKAMSESKNKCIGRQGDVLILALDGAEAGEEIKATDGRHVLAEGETSNHVHAVDAGATRLYKQVRTARNATAREDQIDRILEVIAKTSMHIEGLQSRARQDERHTPIELPPGKYRVRIMREYSSGMVRRVLD